MAYVVGLTGGLAAGKSTVAGWLREAGFLVVDADRLVAELYRPGQPGARAVVELFGASFLDSEGAVDRGALAQLIFSDPESRSRLEKAIHPLVRQRFSELAASHSGVAIYEATLLVESKHAEAFDLIITVEAASEIRLERAMARGMGESEARSRLLAQGDGTERRAAADVILDSSGSFEELRSQVDDLVAEWKMR